MIQKVKRLIHSRLIQVKGKDKNNNQKKNNSKISKKHSKSAIIHTISKLDFDPDLRLFIPIEKVDVEKDDGNSKNIKEVDVGNC